MLDWLGWIATGVFTLSYFAKGQITLDSGSRGIVLVVIRSRDSLASRHSR